jgi:nicotinate-nucleotide pyrophosphorylase (carboxylating)
MDSLHFEWVRSDLQNFLREDDWGRNGTYLSRLPRHPVSCTLKLKSPGIVGGLPFFLKVFEILGIPAAELPWSDLRLLEGQYFDLEEGEVLDLLKFNLPLHVALNGERLALNLCQRASRIATTTEVFVKMAKPCGVRILDTRKTTPGLRFLEKYAVRLGGGENHRFGQADIFMVKDNHKTSFGGLSQAIHFFKSLGSFYTPIIVEIHKKEEIEEARKEGIKHFLLDNFTPRELSDIIATKKEGETFEASGGINETNIKSYLIEGLSAISMSALTNHPQPMDLSFKFKTL